MLPERVTLDPPQENAALAPLDLMGTDRSWGVYVMAHDYTPPKVISQDAGSADTDGDPVVQNKYGNRTISVKVRIFEPEDLAATNSMTNPSGELVKKFTNGASFEVTRQETSTAIPTYRGDFFDKHAYTAGATKELGFWNQVFPAAGTYVISLWVWIPAAWDGGNLSLSTTGSYVGSSDEVALVSSDTTKRAQWQRISTQVTVVAGDLNGTISLVISGAMPSGVPTGVVYSDNAQVEEVGNQVTAKTTRKNLVVNPSFEVDVLNWTAGTGGFRSNVGAAISRVVEQKQFDAASMKVVASNVAASEGADTGNIIPFVSGRSYQVTAYVRGNAGGEALRLWVGDAVVGSASKEFVASNPAFTRIELTFTATGTGNSGVAIVTSAKSASTFFVDGVMVEDTTTVGAAYFPTAAQVTAGEVLWTGTANASTSVFLSSKLVATPYFDGNTPGCDWAGALNASASTRPAPDGTRFSRIYRDVLAKLDRIKRLKTGTYRRQAPGFQPITFDLRNAEVTEAPSDTQLGMKRAEIGLAFEADPGGRTPEVQIGAVREETALPCLVFLAEGVPGDMPGLGRLAIEDKQAQNQLLAWWGAQHDTYDASANAALFYEAESRTPKGAAATAVLAGASGGGSNSILHAALVPDYQVVMTTQASGGGAHMQHFGSYHVYARVWRPTTNTGEVSMRLVWAEGDFARVNENDEVVFAVDDREGRFVLVDLGYVDLAQVPAGTAQRWEGRVLAKSTVVSDDINVDCLFFQPITEAAGEARGVGIGTTGITYLGYDSLALTFGTALAARVATIGGTWGGGGDVDDFKGSGISVGRLAPGGVSDVAGVGRYAWLSETKYTSSAARVNISTPASWSEMTGKLFGGTFLRYVDTNNWVMAVMTVGNEDGKGKIAWLLQVYKKVAGTKTLIGSTILRYAYIGEPLSNILVTFACVSTVWAVEVYEPYSGITVKLSGSDAVLGTTLKEGRLGIYHENQVASVGEGGPMYLNAFTAWEPTLDEAVFASRQLEVRSDRARRQDASGVTWGDVSYEGNYLRVLPAGPDKVPTRFIVKLSRDPDADEGIDDLAATLFVQPRYLVAPAT